MIRILDLFIYSKVMIGKKLKKRNIEINYYFLYYEFFP